MGCFKEIYIEQMGLQNWSETLKVEIDPQDLETLLNDEKDEFTLSLFRHPEDSIFRRLSVDLLS